MFNRDLHIDPTASSSSANTDGSEKPQTPMSPSGPRRFSKSATDLTVANILEVRVDGTVQEVDGHASVVRPFYYKLLTPKGTHVVFAPSQELMDSAVTSIHRRAFSSSLVLTKYLEKNMSSFQSAQSCLDVSVACGVTGVYLSYILPQGCKLILGDLPKRQFDVATSVLINCSEDAWTQNVEIAWYDNSDRISQPVDLIVGIDCVFRKKELLPMIKVLYSISKPDTQIIIAHDSKDPMIEDGFSTKLEEYFTILEVINPEVKLSSCKDFVIIRMQRKGSK
eukprot:TRINITY_DN0_c0_g3_i1.p1 TRINITY_DN0_c0_g3~~TRINITY_DN0_c0_g3_i1.p1  ORF type:complete len:280 (-),score=59.87 TRINITY_DN0_c0_g3_i1:240-1079(-)